jgi:hypothetical protein
VLRWIVQYWGLSAHAIRRSVVATGCLLAVLAVPVDASANAPLPGPGTAAQVAALVAASSKIQRLPSNLVPSLYQAGNDDVAAYYPVTEPGCAGASQCVFGDTHATATIVAFGDSHALMWLTALIPTAVADKLKLVLMWRPSCPAATVSVWNPQTNSINAACNTYRTAEEKVIKKLHPVLVLLASRTTAINGAKGRPIPAATWRNGLEATIAATRSATTRVAVIGDIVAFNAILPNCLAANPDHVQLCSVTDPNPKIPGHFADELAAAKAMKVPYLNPQPWLCTSVCSPVIGNLVSYYNNEHVSATYAAYLAGVWATALRPLLAHHT